jgi:hypothetical protein
MVLETNSRSLAIEALDLAHLEKEHYESYLRSQVCAICLDLMCWIPEQNKDLRKNGEAITLLHPEQIIAHPFHTSCLNGWKDGSCPTCRSLGPRQVSVQVAEPMRPFGIPFDFDFDGGVERNIGELESNISSQSTNLHHLLHKVASVSIFLLGSTGIFLIYYLKIK